jgi:hypothetical protein
MEQIMPDQYDSYTSDRMANPIEPNQINLAEVSMNGNFVLFDYYDNGENKFRTVDAETLIQVFNLQDDKAQDPHHYVPKKKRNK